MSLIANCLGKLVKSGQITKKAADDALAIHEGVQGRLIGTMPPSSVDAVAALEAARIMGAEAKRRKLSIAKSAIALRDARAFRDAHPKGKIAGTMALLTRDISREPGTGGSVFIRQEVATQWLLSKAHEFVDAFRSKVPGMNADFVGTRSAVRELFGHDTGDQMAKQAAGGWEAAVTAGVERLRAGGSMLTTMDEWRLPQHWDTQTVRNRTGRGQRRDLLIKEWFDAWESGELKLWDKTTGAEATALRVPEILDEAFTNIMRGRGTNNSDMRVFRFQDPDAWWRFMSKWGAGETGIYGLMLSHLNSMGREMGLIERLGPDHFANFRALHDEAVNAWDGMSTAAQQASRVVGFETPRALQRTYDHLTGALHEVEDHFWAAIGSTTRSLTTGALLGSATVRAVPGDSVTAVLAHMRNGLPPTRFISGFIKSLGQSPKERRAVSARLHLTARAAMDFGTQIGRFEGALDMMSGRGSVAATVSRGSARLADFVIRASGLKAWTDRAKSVFAMEFSAFLAESYGLAYKELPSPLRGFFRRHGITPQEWDVIAASEPFEWQDAVFFDPEAVDRAISDKILGGILDERYAGVLEPDARQSQARGVMGKSGTLGGELMRSALVFKSFPMAMMTNHIIATLTSGPWWSRPLRLAGVLSLMTFAGAAGNQAYDILRGRDPADMGTTDFWMRAAWSGGGLGFYGDLVHGAIQDPGQTFNLASVSAPINMAADTVALFSPGTEWGRNPRDFGEKLARYVERWTPGSTLWYARAAMDRYIFDFIQQMGDPDYRRSFLREEQRLRDRTGQEFWWAPGETSPRRAPDLGAMVP
jgi:hypothetical protein